MPLSEEELRLLEQMERALVAEDPKFASALRGTARRQDARRRSIFAGVVFVIGIAVMMTGAIISNTVVGIVGFVVMLGSAFVALSYWRRQSAPAPSAPGAQTPDAGFGLSVLEGGKKSKKRTSRPRQGQPQGSMMERFEERWRRRRGQSGF